MNLGRAVSVLLTCVGVALVTVFTAPATAGADDSAPPGPVYESTFGTVFDGTQGAGGGTITVWLTEDSSAVARVNVQGLQAGTPDFLITYGRDGYYVPPRPFVDGERTVGLPITTFGMVQASIEVVLRIDAEAVLSGTAQLIGTFTLPAVPFEPTGPSEPSLPAGEKRIAQIEGQDGSMTFIVGESGDVEWFSLAGVSFAPCYDEPVTMQAMLDRTSATVGEGSAWVLFSDLGLRFISVDAELIGEDYAGTLSLSGTRVDQCEVTLNWSTAPQSAPTATAPAAEAPISTPGPEPGLPSTGQGPPRSDIVVTLAAVMAAVGLLFAASALRRT